NRDFRHLCLPQVLTSRVGGCDWSWPRLGVDHVAGLVSLPNLWPPSPPMRTLVAATVLAVSVPTTATWPAAGLVPPNPTACLGSSPPAGLPALLVVVAPAIPPVAIAHTRWHGAPVVSM